MVCILILMHQDIGVFPTPVGVFPMGDSSGPVSMGLPHASGGVSSTWPGRSWREKSSPRQWGCFLKTIPLTSYALVFPTPVGVFPIQKGPRDSFERLPHASGGVSKSNALVSPICSSSPRQWGCFLALPHDGTPGGVFPTPVGVFPRPGRLLPRCRSLPHASGGVSSDSGRWNH